MSEHATAPHPELQLQTESSAEETVLRCSGKITSATSAILRESVRSIIPPSRRVVLDLTNVTNMDSTGLGTIVSLYLTARRSNCEFKLIHLTQRIKELLKITNLASILAGHEEYLGYTPD